ncbi:hypothetical protein [Leisingera sp. ANG-Vp]|uniref:hypothetical protein n=1 Tax=Leisingera sp. ANG-Vp TaxID=1577896 RepID=UPI00057FE561|nr:hypothetical protein [Leisingera sp. ANG-Vp]KIC15012.1 hypothetical protein RA20_19145 [Leisingera sp. ANG-Vp]
MISSAELAYLVDAKQKITNFDDLNNIDVFISAFNDSERVRYVFNEVVAKEKFWWILPEYNYSGVDLGVIPASDKRVEGLPENEAELILQGVDSSGITDPSNLDICIDITGFMRPHIFMLLKFFETQKAKSLTILYSEPERYSRGADTSFSLKDIQDVRQVSGYEGSHIPDTSKDVLLLGVGYDHQLMGQAIRFKEGARLLQLLSLPSLAADMYQESLIRVDRVDTDELNPPGRTEQFCSANDPFLVAASASKLYHRELRNGGITNFYLCPLATKPQALGFGLFYLRELVDTASSVIFPFPRRYSKETSKGVGRIWRYPIVF